MRTRIAFGAVLAVLAACSGSSGPSGAEPAAPAPWESALVSCRHAGSPCADARRCCSGTCTRGACALLAGGTCATLGEACARPSDCCSTNCRGASGTGVADGTCMPVSFCNAPGDICHEDEDCCSGVCSSRAGQPGRCGDAPGGCGLDGYPCTTDSRCCNRVCDDTGYGARSCQRTDGCRMNGNHCDSTSACCNVNAPPVPESQYVVCDPRYHVCENGGACNPPGDVCGYKASQDCCYGKKSVCKTDVNGVMRCFGGPPEYCGLDSECDPGSPCPTGYTGVAPCCIAAGGTCQFRDQCCGGAPCVPDATGVLRCESATCSARGTACAASGECCAPLSCESIEGRLVCADAPPRCTLAAGASCTVGSAEACCSAGLCTALPSTRAGTCALCAPAGNACTANAQCCSNVCDPELGVCRANCADGGSCATSSDCCTPLVCTLETGATGGTCRDCLPSGADCAPAVSRPCCRPDAYCVSKTDHSRLCTSSDPKDCSCVHVD